MATVELLRKTLVPGPEHRRELEEFIGQEFDPYDYSKTGRTRFLASEALCGIYYDCYLLADGRVYVARTDRYGCYTKATLWPDQASWSQWWYVDRRRGEIDPETGRPFGR